MERIEVGRYANPQEVGYSGWINPEREKEATVPAWIVFIRTDGTVALGIRNDQSGELEFS